MTRALVLLPGSLAARLLGTGAVLGLAAGAAWAAGRALSDRASRDEQNNPRLLNWSWARTIATRVASAGEAAAWAHGTERDFARRQYADLIERSTGLVAAYTGIRLPSAVTQVHVFDRAEWVDANLAQFRLLFAPLDEAYARMIARTRRAGAVGVMGQVVLSGQMGLLMGYLARKVLGQYDLSLLGREPVPEGRLYFVEPNIAAMEQRYQLSPSEFRAWIALHEVTHAFEFEGHPWVRALMNDLLTDYLRSLSEDLFGDPSQNVLATWLGRAKDNFFERGHILELMMSRQQREVFRRLQALMAVMEGYSNHVMDHVGRQQLREHDRLKQTFESRARQRGPAEQLFIRLTGLDVKLEQYVLGERFCQQVVEAKGIDFLNRVWHSADNLPTLDEIHYPEQWIARQGAAARL